MSLYVHVEHVRTTFFLHILNGIYIWPLRQVYKIHSILAGSASYGHVTTEGIFNLHKGYQFYKGERGGSSS